jgi:hypothetical protein
MEILNETVYDSDDLDKVIRYAQQKAYEYEVRVHKNHPHMSVPHVVPLPAQVRFGYYNNPKEEKGFVSVRGRVTRTKAPTIRIGIAPPAKLPLEAMEIIAREAADKEERSMPSVVLGDLLTVLMRSLFRAYVHRFDTEEDQEWLMDGCPAIHYGFEVDRKSAVQSKTAAATAALDQLRRNIKYSEERLVRLEECRVEEEEKLVRLRARLAKLEGRKEMSFAGMSAEGAM